jgi:uncharacterized protein
MEWFKLAQWSPYIVGIGIGVLSWLAFILSDRPLGCSTAFVRVSGMIEKIFRGNKVNEKEYYKENTPEIDWQLMLVLGVAIGSFVSVWMSGQFHWQWIPSFWAKTAGNIISMRMLVALVGGVLISFGARWAGGCTSGHGISGTLQLAISSWVFTISFFISGIVTAMLIFKVIL